MYKASERENLRNRQQRFNFHVKFQTVSQSDIHCKVAVLSNNMVYGGFWKILSHGHILTCYTLYRKRYSTGFLDLKMFLCCMYLWSDVLALYNLVKKWKVKELRVSMGNEFTLISLCLITWVKSHLQYLMSHILVSSLCKLTSVRKKTLIFSVLFCSLNILLIYFD